MYESHMEVEYVGRNDEIGIFGFMPGAIERCS